MAYEFKPWKSPSRTGNGRPRISTERFDFRAEDLIVESGGPQDHRTAIITHKPTGITVEGHDARNPTSLVGARKDAMRKLKEQITGLAPDAYIAPPRIGDTYTDRQWMAIKAYFAEFPAKTPARMVVPAKLANEAIGWYNAQQGKNT
jgi:hypothetical protein